MLRTTVSALLLVGWLVLPAPTVRAQTTTTSSSTSTTILIGGGGGAGNDCLLVLGTAPNMPTSRPRHIRCADGDLCDADGTVNGVCQFKVSACGNSTFDPRCTSPGVATLVVDHALDNGDPKFDPEFQAFQNVLNTIDTDGDTPDDCTTVIDFHVFVQGPFANNSCRRSKKLLRIDTTSDFVAGRAIHDRDRLRMMCDPSPAGCDPMAFYTSAFDRIQRQIFNQSCAVSGCHDSQSFAESGNLLLEQGAAYTNLLGNPPGTLVIPDNDAAEAAGWFRVNQTDPTTGDPETSLLFRKVDHDLPSSAFGLGMPRLRPKLDQSLIDVIAAWIAAGAPETGWPIGTF
jgi:hypothetical protein